MIHFKPETEIKNVCVFCGKKHSVYVNMKDLIDWERGKFVQDAFPYLSPDERELFVSKVCVECSKEAFKEQ